jgi:hypothetical protein
MSMQPNSSDVAANLAGILAALLVLLPLAFLLLQTG